MPSRDAKTGELEYGYHPPASVKEADRKECVAQAEIAAQGAATPVSTTEENTTNAAGVMFGALGAVANLGYLSTRIRHEREVAYEKSMRTCLTDKGYSLP